MTPSELIEALKAATPAERREIQTLLLGSVIAEPPNLVWRIPEWAFGSSRPLPRDIDTSPLKITCAAPTTVCSSMVVR